MFVRSLALGACLLAPHALSAQQAPSVSLELNALSPSEGACLVSFVAKNTLSHDIESAIYEAVLFDKDGAVNRLTLLDFGNLPAERPRVRQFGLNALACDQLGQILINGAQTCTVGAEPSDLCADTLVTTSRTDVEVTG